MTVVSVDVAALLASMTLDEKAALTAGEDIFSLPGVERLGIPKVRVTDGPSGARGVGLPGGDDQPSNCIPCGTALGATWDVDLVERIGAVVGRDARGQGCRGLLAPTVNLHRSPRAGRNFECWSEDPLLTGRLAAAFVRGAQAQGVFAVVKHFVGNEAEFERNTIDSVIDERSLRELYLLPFELVIREGGALGVMTSYNRMNGTWLNEQRRYLTELLRDEWGFDGLVMTDWFAAVHPELSLAAGLDLEMPGPGRQLGATVATAVRDGRVDEGDVDTAVGHLLGLFERLGLLGGPADPIDPLPEDEATDALLRATSAASIVLLTNSVLPLDPSRLSRVAVVGPRAALPTITGGGSAQLASHRVLSPADELARALGDVRVDVSQGVADVTPAALGSGWFPAPGGFTVERFEGAGCAGDPTTVTTSRELRVMALDLAPTPSSSAWSMRVRGTMVPTSSGPVELLLAQAGAARVWLDGQLVLDGVADPPPAGGTEMFGLASQDLVAEVHLVAGRPTEVVVEFEAQESFIAGFRVAARTTDEDAMLERAVEAATGASAVVVFVGTNGDHETEGRDRADLRLPGRQDELVERIAAVNPRTIVVVNAGGIVDLPWASQVGAVLQCWFGGQQMGGAVADVLVGAAEPGGRLPSTIGRRLEHHPSHDNFPGENGQLRYGEGLFMGYRGFEHHCIEPQFAFGHGLSYTTFTYGAPTLSASTLRAGESVTVSVVVTNRGERAGSEVVQVYVAPHRPRLARPGKELKGFAKVHLQPGEWREVEVVLDRRSFAYWDPGQADHAAVAARSSAMFMAPAAAQRRPPGWQVDPGTYSILVGTSSADIFATEEIVVLGHEEVPR